MLATAAEKVTPSMLATALALPSAVTLMPPETVIVPVPVTPPEPKRPRPARAVVVTLAVAMFVLTEARARFTPPDGWEEAAVASAS